MEGISIVVLIPATVLGVLLLVFGYAPEIKHWWWMRKQKPMMFDLVVLQLTGPYSFLAEHEEWGRTLFSVTWDIKSRNKFAVKPGEKVRVIGKNV